MGASDRDYMKAAVADPADEAAPAAGPAWLAKLNAIGEKHATAIISASTALIILIVLIFAKHYYDKAQVERAEQEVSAAETSEQLLALKTRYGSTPVGPRILFRLANKYYEDGKLEAARNEYTEFKTRYPNDPLSRHVLRALGSVEKNLRFEAEGREARLREAGLMPHPSRMADAGDARLAWGPAAAVKPMAELALPGGVVKVELLEDEAPEAVAHFVKLAQAGHFNGLKLEEAGDARLQTAAKAPAGGDFQVAADKNSRGGEAGNLVLVHKDGAAPAGRFALLTRSVPELKDAVVFGVVTEGLPLVAALKKDDAVVSVRITAKRDHPYEPKPLKK